MSKLSNRFLKQVETFLRRTGMPATAFGKAVNGDPNLVYDLRNGRKPNLDLCEKCLKFIAKYDSDDLLEV
jgi:predicted transcriptional regulator